MLFWILNSRKSEKLLRAGLALLATFFQVCTAPHFNVTETHASTPSKVDTIHWSHCVLLASKAAVWVRPLFTAKFFISQLGSQTVIGGSMSKIEKNCECKKIVFISIFLPITFTLPTNQTSYIQTCRKSRFDLAQGGEGGGPKHIGVVRLNSALSASLHTLWTVLYIALHKCAICKTLTSC